MRLTGGLSGTTVALLVLLALAVAGVTHAAAILTIPWRSHRDAFSRVAALAPIGTKTLLPETGAASGAIPFRDPALLMAVCRFDLTTQPFRLSLAPFDSGFVTLGFHSRHGLGFYGLTVRAADATSLDLVVVGRDGGHTTDPHAVTVESPEPEGFVTMATPAVDGPGRADALARLDALRCSNRS